MRTSATPPAYSLSTEPEPAPAAEKTWERRRSEQELLDDLGEERPSLTAEWMYVIADDADPVYIEPDVFTAMGWVNRLPEPFALMIDTGGGEFDLSMGSVQNWSAAGYDDLTEPEVRVMRLRGLVEHDANHGWWVISFRYMWWDTNFM